ncbi:MAG TPA: GNA1162 family protein [Candidatus Binatia bacterium]
MIRRGAALFLIVTAILASSCAAKVDYGLYRSRLPRSILVLPPQNASTAVEASYIFLSTASRPLAEAGYYIFPVAVIDAFMKENGLPTPDEMSAVPLKKIKEVFGADAVLYFTIEEWGQKYYVISSQTVVRASARLVDVETGATLWTGRAQAVRDSGGGGQGLIGALVAAAVSQIVFSMVDQTHELSRFANTNMVFDKDNGLLFGPRHPEYGADPRGR